MSALSRYYTTDIQIVLGIRHQATRFTCRIQREEHRQKSKYTF